MRPLFSIITVTYNAEDTIGATLQSVKSQTCDLYEHIIVDGNSTDHTADIVSNFENDRVIWSTSPDNGIYDAMNKGIMNAHGDYIMFLNSGDRFHSPQTLQHYADAIMDNDYPGIVYGQTDLIDKDGKYLGPRHLQAPENLTSRSFIDGMVVCHQSMAVYTKLVGLFNLKYKYSADYEWAIICLQHSKHNVYLPETTIDYLSEGMTTKHHKDSLIERFEIMRSYYGSIPTVLRHLKFAVRYLGRRKNAVNNQ